MDFRKLFISKKIFLNQLYPDLKLLLVSHKFEYYDTEKDTIEIETKDLAKEWQAYDNRIYGRYFWNMKTPNSFLLLAALFSLLNQ